ncbi:MFS transporter, partial [Acinetobacter baumannii]|uniref:solute carrier family 23 protein n=1 Tax=Acinetobacter baumannii TaxID=470 RepID=UPI0018DEA6A0|nr:MFS transporter [Acinetobacter baumannii]
KYGGLFYLPPSITSVVGQVDVAGALNIGLAGIIFSFMLVNLFDSSGTLIGVTDKAGLTDNQGKFPRMKQALYVDSISSVAGSLAGTSSVTAYIESSSGVAVGGRTGLTAVVTGLLFLLVIFLSPLAGYGYDRIGFADTYLLMGCAVAATTLVSCFLLRGERSASAAPFQSAIKSSESVQ